MQYWKKSFKPLLTGLILWMLSLPALCQELNFTVKINAQNIQTSNPQIFQEMEKTFREFLNSRQWTEDRFGQKEKIFGNMIITITDNPAINSYVATAQIQSSRPVYNTSYQSLLLNYADRDWKFEYAESQPLDFNKNTFTTNLTSMLAFYAYVVLGYDYDSFSKMGGQAYFRQANNIAQNAQQQNTQGAGWQPFGSNRNRYWLVENLMSPQMIPVREAIYEYHRLGMDIFAEKPDEARLAILEALKKVQKADKVKPNSLLIRSFFDAKRQEIIKIFSQGEQQVRQDAYNLLIKIDPTNRSDYDKLIK